MSLIRCICRVGRWMDAADHRWWFSAVTQGPSFRENGVSSSDDSHRGVEIGAIAVKIRSGSKMDEGDHISHLQPCVLARLIRKQFHCNYDETTSD